MRSGRQQGDTVADESPSGSVDRESLRLVLVICCLLAVTTAAVLVASAGAGLAGSPIDRLLPGETIPEYRTNDSADNPLGSLEGDGGGFGSLNPGQRTGVGGETGFDRETFASTDTSVHFVAESPRPTYWRTGAYETYTGSGWERSVDTDPFEGSVEHTGQNDERIEYEIELQRPARALPTPWRPTTISGIDEPWITDSGAVETTEQVSAGTTYSGVSYSPERDPELLRAAGDPPSDIERQYTALPGGVPDRVGDRTADVTQGTETSFDAAVAIQTWLRENKEYSLQASARSQQITDTFLFEMDAGYCEYFATAMTVMLRTQDIPARYVVGYSSGQPTGDGTYEVRGMNAHAWVEVYFDGYGWIRFDPTPGDSRLETQSDILDDDNLEEPGSPGETFEPGDIETDDPTDENDPADPDPTDPDPDETGPQLSLNTTPVAGAPVEVRVTDNGSVVTGASVQFDGQQIGRTDERGTVTGTVPNTEEVRVTVEHPVFAPEGSVTQNYTVDTSASVRVTGEVIPGAQVTVTAVIDNRPVENATVTVDGEAVAETDESGQARLSLPERSGTARIAVERGAIDGATTVALPALSVTVESDLPVALPFGPATVEARYGNVSAAGVPVTVNGNRVTEIGPDGTASVRFPLAPSATVVAGNEVSAQTTVSALGWNLAGVFLVAFVVSLLVAALVRYRHSVRGALAVPIGLLLGGGRSRTRENGQLGSALATLPDRLGRALATLLDRLGRALAGLRSVRLFQSLRSKLGVGEPDEERGSQSTAGTHARSRSVAETTVREGWEQFLDQVSVPAATRTPEELAAHATERDGLPAEPVRTLRDAFRAVEYGSRPAEDWAERVEDAVERIEETVQADAEGDS
jgi:transglutaminase-like putative cysteine protease